MMERLKGTSLAIAVLAFAAGSCTILLLQATSIPVRTELIIAMLFAGFMTVAWLYPLPLIDKTKLYLDTAVTMAAILYFEPGIAMLIVGVGTLSGQLLRRQPWDQTLFNGAQTMLQAAGGAVALAATDFSATQILSPAPGQLLIITVVGTIVSLINLLAVAIVVGLQTGTSVVRSVVKIIRSMAVIDYTAQAIQVGLGVIAATLAVSAPWALILLLAPSAAIYWVLQHNTTLRQNLSQALDERDASLAKAERIAKLGSWEWKLATTEYYWSDEIYRLLGIDRDTVTPSFETFQEYVHPDDRGVLSDTVKESVRSGMGFDLEHRIVCADGAERVVQTHGAVVCDVMGQPTRMVGTVHDITEQKDLQARLLEQASRSPLTPREVELLGYLARGNANKEIAVQLGISEQTVKNHISSILRKLRVSDRTQAVVYAIRQGWIDSNPHVDQ